jgi:hypothetical protein
VNKVGLIKISARKSDFRPIDALTAARYVPQHSFWGHTRGSKKRAPPVRDRTGLLYFLRY